MFPSALHRCLHVGLIGSLMLMANGLAQAKSFGFDDVASQALQLSRKPYAANDQVLPAELKGLNYDQSRDIRFKPERAVWRNEKLPFELMMFHVSRVQTQSVRINEVTAKGVQHIAFTPDAFDYGKNKLTPQSWGDVGFAGFRIHYALNSAAYKDELVVFLGASYFRALGKDQHYGLSARGLGIDTGGGAKEEFPRFTEFWIERPAANATSIVVNALLDSPRATGAYEITLRPGDNTLADVRSRIFLRAGVSTLGIAPLTSMFHHGENQPSSDDFRPEVHDSDGLMVATGEGEWLWRPLINPKNPLTTSFATRELKGFGLMQRDREFKSYEDGEAQYDRRPSAWITPKGNWGPGRVELYQWPTADETADNIVAYWVPERVPAAGQPLDIAYQMAWQGKQQQRPPAGWVTQSRLGRGVNELGANEVQYIVDFTGPALNGLAADAAVKAVVSAGSNGKVTETNAYPNSASGGWRLMLRAQRINPQQPLELRAFLQQANNALTETWTNIIQPN